LSRPATERKTLAGLNRLFLSRIARSSRTVRRAQRTCATGRRFCSTRLRQASSISLSAMLLCGLIQGCAGECRQQAAGMRAFLTGDDRMELSFALANATTPDCLRASLKTLTVPPSRPRWAARAAAHMLNRCRCSNRSYAIPRTLLH
jgi:hypothetical protein